jgi:epoxyqueuosine reductase
VGFSLFGVAPPQADPDDLDRLRGWLARGCAAEMERYLGREPESRVDATRLLPSARSVVVVGISYAQPPPDLSRLSGQPEGRVARFALGHDYHDVLSDRLGRLGRFLAAWPEWPPEWGEPVWRSQVDAGPLLERAFSRLAGVGFIGRNNCLIHPEWGSWFVLGVLISNAPLEADRPLESRCGGCHRCVEACPTGALAHPYSLDARRCLSYRTIETRGPIEPDLAQRMGDRLFGCDACQEACPFNSRKDSLLPADPQMCTGASREENPTGEKDRETQLDGANATLETILRIPSNREFERRFAGSPLLRARRRGLIRNALIVARNLGRQDLIEAFPDKFNETVGRGKEEGRT